MPQATASPDTNDVVIVDDSGAQHHFPAGFDPKKAAGIVQQKATAGPTKPLTPSDQYKGPDTYAGGFVKGLKDAGTDLLRTTGKTLKESLPFLGGAAGGAIGATLAAPTALVSGPAGPLVGGVVGAGAGGAAGRILEQGIDYLTGKSPRPTFLGAIGEGGKAATTQMEQQMGGEIIAAPLGFLRRGGFLKASKEAMDTLRENRALDMHLSGPEIVGDRSALGSIGKSLQQYGSGAFGGRPIQLGSREAGTRSALKIVDDSLALLGHAGMNSGPTAISKGLAAEDRAVLGKFLDHAADRAPAVDVSEVKELAARELEKGIAKHLSAVPDVADPRLAALIRQVRNNPDLIQKAPRPILTRLSDLILEKYKSPSLSLLRRVVGMEDQTPARGLWNEIQDLRAKGKPVDELYAKSDTQRLSSLFSGKLRAALAPAAPELNKALSMYHDLVRGDYIKNDIVLGGAPPPTNEADANRIMTGMATRLREAVNTGQIAREFNDPVGRQVIQNVTRVANLMERRTPESAGFIRKIFEISRIMGATMTSGAALASGKVPPIGALATGGAWEALPDFYTWLIHDPKATSWFIEGASAKNPVQSSAALVRLMDLYKQTQQPEPAKPNGTATPTR